MITMDVLLNYLHLHTTIIIVVIAVVFDTMLGAIRSWKERKTNSSIGIDGMTRKTSMLACVVFLYQLNQLVA